MHNSNYMDKRSHIVQVAITNPINNGTGILPRILGQPYTNSNKSKLNRFCFLIMSSTTEKVLRNPCRRTV